MGEWNSTQYLKFEKERTQPSVDLASRIDLNHPKSVLDIGCGPGNSSGVLKKRFPNARVLGIDISANMLERARRDYPEIQFQQVDISREKWPLAGDFDVVFSNACLQWVPNHPRLLVKMMNLLKDGGRMAVQIPINFEEPIHRIIKEIATHDRWRDKISRPRIFYTLTAEEYYDILAEISSDFSMWVTTYCHRMKSHNSIIEWYKGTGLKPYLEVLSEEDGVLFINEVANEVKKQYRTQKNGEIIFRFPRLFFVAAKG